MYTNTLPQTPTQPHWHYTPTLTYKPTHAHSQHPCTHECPAIHTHTHPWITYTHKHFIHSSYTHIHTHILEIPILNSTDICHTEETSHTHKSPTNPHRPRHTYIFQTHPDTYTYTHKLTPHSFYTTSHTHKLHSNPHTHSHTPRDTTYRYSHKHTAQHFQHIHTPWHVNTQRSNPHPHTHTETQKHFWE